ncbi:MAG TPA: imidazolonepropionase [Candidatus Eremiobacteraceae bacterium]|nr:imidazolonepropionase [Candidatus Eremiobacteraceae bacterium]
MVGKLLGATFAISDATIVTMRPLASASLKAGVTDDDLGIIEHATLVAGGGRIIHIGRDVAIPDGVDVIDAGGAVVMPGFIDAHTHALFAGDRVADFDSLAAGRAPTLGIRYTVEQTRRCSPSELVEIGARKLGLMLEHGTTTAEVKSGYALSAAGEVAMLEALAALDSFADMPHVVATFCGAHALPPEFSDYDSFVDELVARILPRVADAKIARYADAFCERGYFSNGQSARFLKASANAGLRLRMHADELSASGGARLAADLRCDSADHLNFVDRDGIRALAASGTIAVLCPATTEYLGLDRYAPARELIDAGVPVALATDFNPGTSPCPSLQVVAHLARRRLRMTVAETIAGITVQAARSLRSDSGVLDEGRAADLVVLKTCDVREFGYYYGADMVSAVAVGRWYGSAPFWASDQGVTNQRWQPKP